MFIVYWGFVILAVMPSINHHGIFNIFLIWASALSYKLRLKECYRINLYCVSKWRKRSSATSISGGSLGLVGGWPYIQTQRHCLETNKWDRESREKGCGKVIFIFDKCTSEQGNENPHLVCQINVLGWNPAQRIFAKQVGQLPPETFFKNS